MTTDDRSPLDWTDAGQPRSRLYGDIYFSTEDGLAETRAVFLDGCGLPEAWRGRRRFTVAELGFGAGLNILALLDLWRREAPADGWLHVFSVEGHPLTAAEAARALAPWAELEDIAAGLLAQWPGQALGPHRIDLPELRATIDVAVGEVGEALAGWSGKADAWFLDGFSPALNPAMWRDEVMALVAGKSAPGARAATFTVAGAVRRGLADQGFAVEKKPGYGRKLQRLEARLPEAGPPPAPPDGVVAVIGAGIAGAALARALRAIGREVRVFDAAGPAAGASGNPAALVTPRLDAGLGPVARLFAQAFRRAVQLYETQPALVIARGVLQLARQDRDPGRFAVIAASGLFEPGALAVLTPDQASERLGDAAPAALEQAPALIVEPRAVVEAWCGPVETAGVVRLEPTASGWRLLGRDGETVAEAAQVVVAAGPALRELLGLPLQMVRGQASWTAGIAPSVAAAWGGYVAPTRDGLLFGATHDRDDEGLDLRAEDHRRNLDQLAQALPSLAAAVEARPIEGRASLRAAARDRMPIAGAVPGADGLYVLGGFGSRGFANAPLLAEHVAALASGAPSPLPAPLPALVDPGRLA